MRFLLLLVLLALAMIVQAPAWLLVDQVKQASAGFVDLRSTEGTVWRGSGDVVLVASRPAPREANAGRIDWALKNVAPSTPSATVEIRPVASDPKPLSIVAGPGNRVDLSGSIRLPVNALALVPMLSGWSASGDAVAEIPRLQIGGNSGNGGSAGAGGTGGTGGIGTIGTIGTIAGNGSAAVRWTGARIVPPDLPGGLAIGDATGSVTLADGATTVHLRSSGGDVDVALDVASRSRTITIALQPRPSATATQLAWLQSHTMGRTPTGGFRIDAGWP